MDATVGLLVLGARSLDSPRLIAASGTRSNGDGIFCEGFVLLLGLRLGSDGFASVVGMLPNGTF